MSTYKRYKTSSSPYDDNNNRFLLIYFTRKASKLMPTFEKVNHCIYAANTYTTCSFRIEHLDVVFSRDNVLIFSQFADGSRFTLQEYRQSSKYTSTRYHSIKSPIEQTDKSPFDGRYLENDRFASDGTFPTWKFNGYFKG